MVHIFIQRRQQQGEYDNGLMKVVKEDIIYGKTGKSRIPYGFVRFLSDDGGRYHM